MASTAQHSHSFPPRPYSSAIGHHAKLAGTNTGRDNRLDRERVNQAQAGSSNPMMNITEEQREEINEALLLTEIIELQFGLFDLDKDQRIDYHEFKVALKALGFDLTKPAILKLLTAHGTPPPNQATGHGKSVNTAPPARLLLTLPAFQSIAAKLIAERDPHEEIVRAFSLFDADHKGMINVDDLRRVARELGESLEEEELVAMIDEFDLEGRGGVTQEEFVSICMG